MTLKNVLIAYALKTALMLCGEMEYKMIHFIYLVYLMNRKAYITVKTPVGDTDPFISTDIVKQGTSLGPILNNCSLSDICAEGINFTFGSVEVKSLEFVDDIADPSYGNSDAVLSKDIICDIQRMKRLKFSTEKCRPLKINSKANDDTDFISGEKVEIKNSFRYSGDIFNSQGNNSDLCKDRLGRAIGTSIEIISLCKQIRISNMLLLY